MRTPLAAILLLILTGVSAYAGDGDTPYKKGFSLEIGAGPGPVHIRLSNVSPSLGDKYALADEGLTADMNDAWYPALSLSGIWRTAPRWEIALTGGVSWCHHKLIRHEEFGIDPYGNTRYDFSQGTPAGETNSTPVCSLTLQGRYLWTPQKKVELYSAFGLGLTTASDYIPIPALTPIALRFGGRHFYVFAEVALNPIALLGHGGLGWRF